MNKLVLYCKSYGKDVHRAKVLLESILKYNVDSIPFYISVPKPDVNLFKETLGEDGYTLLTDEMIDSENGGWKGQQIVKSQFWKLGLCENYICIDSDCFFIKPFHFYDFMFDEQTPYTVCHEYKSFFEFMDKYPLEFDPYESFVKERLHIMDLFGRTGVVYDFGPGPTIWSSKVWKSLFDNYLTLNNLTFSDLIMANGSEFTWYGEWLLHSKVITLMPRGPLFKNYHYPHQYRQDKQEGYGVGKIAKLYLGIGMQSIYNFD
jgi:hypothetical protein